MRLKINKVLTPWLGLPRDFRPEDWAGFVYSVTELSTGRVYLGKKMLWRNLNLKVKGKKRRKRVKNESDWRYYKSSSEEILQGICEQGVKGFRFEILNLYKTRGQVNYEETKELFKRDVLYSLLPSGEYAYFNKNIGGKWYRDKVKIKLDKPLEV
jgi:hypothetical protein